jgi:hypothetical protein
MLSFLLDHAKLAVCDGLSRKAPDSKNAPQCKQDAKKNARKNTIRFDDSSRTTAPKQKHSSLLDNAKLAVCDGFDRKALQSGFEKKARESNAPAQTLQFDNCSLNDVIEQSSRTLNDFAEGVKSLGVTSWWKQDAATDCQKRPMRETILVTNELMKLLSGAAKDKSSEEQTIMKTIEEACNVEMHLSRKHQAGHGMQCLAITGTGDQRDKAKSMIVRLSSSCRRDSLSNVMNAWDNMDSNFSHMHVAGHGFEGWTFEASSPRSETVTKEVCDPKTKDLKSLRTHLQNRTLDKQWRNEREKLDNLDYLWINNPDYRIAA